MLPFFYYFYFLIPQQQSSNFENYYLGIMKNLNADENKTSVKNWFERNYTFTELIGWVNNTLVFDETYDVSQRHWSVDPATIKEIGMGGSVEFSILYVSACLAQGYESRIVVAVDVSNSNYWTDLHVWAEVKMCGWIHVDPSRNMWANKLIYANGEWGDAIGSTVKIYAFDDGKCEDVTLNYLSRSSL